MEALTDNHVINFTATKFHLHLLLTTDQQLSYFICFLFVIVSITI